MEYTTPYLFLPEVIREYVQPGRPGVYVLGDNENGFQYRYVGRSDTCLQTRLLTHNHLYRFEYFIFRYVDSPKDGFLLESKWWHDCRVQGFPLVNQIHPDAPSHSGFTCPYCDFVRMIA